MALPLLAFFGLGLGAKALENQHYQSKMQSLMGEAPYEMAGPTQPGAMPLMSKGTGLMGGEIHPVNAAVKMMGMGGNYGNVGSQILSSYLQSPTARNLQFVDLPTGEQDDQGNYMFQKHVIGPDGTPSPINPHAFPKSAGGSKTEIIMPGQENIGIKDVHRFRHKDSHAAPPPEMIGATAEEFAAAGYELIPEQPTTEESKSWGFYQRMNQSGWEMEKMMAAEPDDVESGMDIGRLITENLDLGGARFQAGRMAPDFLESLILNPKQQKYMQYARDFIWAKLRSETGAEVKADEFASEWETYFPMPGNTPAVLAQKAVARERAILAMKAKTGRAFQDPDTVTDSAGITYEYVSGPIDDKRSYRRVD